MARPTRLALTAVGLLGLTQAAALALSAPVAGGPNLRQTSIPSLPIRGWAAGQVVATHDGQGRVAQQYTASATGDSASVETRCTPDAKGFLTWRGTLAYQGAGYEQQGPTATWRIAIPDATRGDASHWTASRALVRGSGGMILISYAYVDHWGTHPSSPGLWPRAAADLLTRHPGPYCMLGVAVPVSRTLRTAGDDAQQIMAAFLPAVQRLVR